VKHVCLKEDQEINLVIQLVIHFSLRSFLKVSFLKSCFSPKILRNYGLVIKALLFNLKALNKTKLLSKGQKRTFKTKNKKLQTDLDKQLSKD